MLSIIGIWVAIIGMGINLGFAFSFIPPVGQRGDWFTFWVVTPAMVVCASLLALCLAGVL